jgi:hypothetical protein
VFANLQDALLVEQWDGKFDAIIVALRNRLGVLVFERCEFKNLSFFELDLTKGII